MQRKRTTKRTSNETHGGGRISITADFHYFSLVLFSATVSADRLGGGSRHDCRRLARVRAGAVRAVPSDRAVRRQVRGGRAQVRRRRRLRPASGVLVRVRRARPSDGRLQEPAREPARRRGSRLVQPDRPGRHQEDGGLHRGSAQRFQRGRHQGAAGQDVRARPGRVPGSQGVRGLSGGRRQGTVVRARLPGDQGIPLVPGLRLRSRRRHATNTGPHPPPPFPQSAILRVI